MILYNDNITHITLCLLYPAALCSNCTLVTLEVGTNGLTDQAAKQLGEMLKKNTRLEGLSLWQNDLTAEVIACYVCCVYVYVSVCVHVCAHTCV